MKYMFFNRPLFRHVLTALALTGCTIGGINTVAQAQGTPGLVIFGKKGVDILNYHLDFGGVAENRDRYRLRIPKNKLPNGLSRLVISYPEYFDGSFDTDKIEVRPDRDKKKSLPLKSVVWNEKNRFVQIDLEKPLQTPEELEIVMSNTQNPDVGTYYFDAQVVPGVGAPVLEKVGAWVLSINP